MHTAEADADQSSGRPPADLRRWWADVVRQHYADIHRFIRSRVPTDVVDDLVQEVFVSAASSVAGFDPAKGGIWAWLYGIGRNTVAQFYRRTAYPSAIARAETGLDSQRAVVLECLVSESPLPEEICEREELRLVMRAGLSELEPQHRVCLEERYLEGRTPDEIAHRTGLSSSAVNSRLHRARREFRRVLLELVREPSVFEGHRP